MQRKRFYRNEEIEQRAETRLAELEQALERPSEPPVSIDLLAEHVLGLNFCWEAIDELPGEVILAGLRPEDRLIVLNERRQSLFKEHPGLERFTKGHEMGHWDLFIDQSILDHPTLPGLSPSDVFALRSSTSGPVQVVQGLLKDPDGQDLIRDILARQDAPHEARAVNRYSAAISMPRSAMRAMVAGITLTGWPQLYRLAERFEVTISALKVRLDQLNILHITPDGQMFRSRDEAAGQLRML